MATRRSRKRAAVALLAGAALVGAVVAVVLLTGGDSAREVPAVSCKTFTTKETAARREIVDDASPGPSLDNRLVIVDKFCEMSPSATVSEAVARGIGTPPKGDNTVARLSAGLPASVPMNAVAIVGGVPISLSDFDRWVRIAKATSTNTSGDALNDQVMQFLILQRWVTGQAAAEGLAPSEAMLARSVAVAKRQSFPEAGAYQDFLAESGMREADAAFQVRFNTVYALLREKAILRASPVSAAEIATYYNRNRAKWGASRTADVLVVVTDTLAQAGQAKSALLGGQQWDAVAREYSIDEPSRDADGQLRGVRQGTREKALDSAIFAGPPGEIRGPIKTQVGHYVIKVERITPSAKDTLAQATPAIRSQLEGHNRQRADDEYNASLRKRWTAVTLCREPYVMSQCSNG